MIMRRRAASREAASAAESAANFALEELRNSLRIPEYGLPPPPPPPPPCATGPTAPPVRMPGSWVKTGVVRPASALPKNGVVRLFGFAKIHGVCAANSTLLVLAGRADADYDQPSVLEGAFLVLHADGVLVVVAQRLDDHPAAIRVGLVRVDRVVVAGGAAV